MFQVNNTVTGALIQRHSTLETASKMQRKQRSVIGQCSKGSRLAGMTVSWPISSSGTIMLFTRYGNPLHIFEIT